MICVFPPESSFRFVTFLFVFSDQGRGVCKSAPTLGQRCILCDAPSTSFNPSNFQLYFQILNLCAPNIGEHSYRLVILSMLLNFAILHQFGSFRGLISRADHPSFIQPNVFGSMHCSASIDILSQVRLPLRSTPSAEDSKEALADDLDGL